MARFAHDRLGVRRIVLIDDGTDFAARTVLTLARQAGDLGMTVLARKQIPWTEGDYRPQLRELRALDPEALYFAGNQPVGVKVARQVAEVLPSIHRLGAETLYDGAFPIQAGAAADGWYVSNVAPDLAASPVRPGPSDSAAVRRARRPLAPRTAVMVIANAAGHPAARVRARGSGRDQAVRLPDRAGDGVVRRER
jgi:ABC-type branched-subunit amino acid transport system substrate-binding protein